MMIGASLGVLNGTPAFAAENSCDTIVIDSTSEKVLGNTERFTAAVLKLENLGVDVRVRAFDKEPSGTFNAYQKQQVKACPSWQGPDGHTKGNLVTYLFSMDRQSYIFYGSSLMPELEDDVDRIRADYMNDRFRSGKFSDGIIDAIDETAAVIKAYNDPKPIGDTVINEDSSSGGNAFGWVMAILAGIAGAVGLLFGGFKLMQLRQRRKQEREDARHAAEAAQRRASEAMLKLDQGEDVERSVKLLSPKLNAEDKQSLDDLLNDFDALEESAVVLAGKIVDDPTTYSLEKRRTADGYLRIETAHKEVEELAIEAAAVLGKIEATCAQKEQDLVRAPETLQARHAALQELTSKREMLQGEGYRLDLDSNFADISSLLERAGRELEAKRHGHALDELSDTEQLLDGIEATLTRVPEWHQGLQKEHAALSKDLEQLVTSQVTAALGIRGEISSQYTNCDDDLLDEDGINNLVSRARDLLKKAEAEFSMEHQQWAAADQHLSECEQIIVALQQACAYITGRLETLSELESKLSNRTANLGVAIAECFTALDDRIGDQDEFRAPLEAVRRKLGELEGGLSSNKPNPLLIDRELTKLESEVHRIGEDSDALDRKTRRRRQQSSYSSSSSGGSFGTGFGTGVIAGSVFGGSHDSGGWSSGGGSDSGGSSSGSWGGGDGGSSGGGW